MMVSFINKSIIRKLVSSWLSTEPALNYIGLTSNEKHAVFSVQMCGSGSVAGLPFVKSLFEEFGCSVELHVSEGEVLTGETKIATVQGSIGDIMFCERLVLTVLSRASGIASFTKRIRKLLCDLSWKGELRIPPSLTPGFELVEEYAMLVGGAAACAKPIVLRQCHIKAKGGVEEVIGSICSKAEQVSQIAVDCSNADEANAAVKAGANVIILNVMSAKELNILSHIKTADQKIEIQVNGCFDEVDLKDHALSNINYLTTSRLTNGYPIISFQLAYETDREKAVPVKKRNAPSLQEPTPTNAVPDTDQNSDTKQKDSDLPVEAASPTASDPKKARTIKDDVKKTVTPSPAKESKPNGSPNRRTGSSSVQSSTTKDQPGKRQQKNSRASYNAANRLNTPRNQSPSVLQLHQTNQQRFNSPLSRGSFGQGQQQQSGSSPMPGAVNSQSPGFRLSSQLLPPPQQRQQLNPNLLSAAFLNIQQRSTAQQQSQVSQPPSWSSMAGSGSGGGGGMGQGMRFGSNMPLSCRSCGSTNGPGMSFCRNCRNPLR